MRGVMEKCTYCVQRINAARIESKLADLRGSDGKHFIPDGFFQTDCQQACPSNSIEFGNILDTNSKVSKMRENARSYMLLGYLNTRPRTTHMVRVMNPNPQLVSAERRAEWDTAPGAHGGHGSHEGGHESHEGGGHEHAGEKHSAGAKSLHVEKKRTDRGYALSLKVLGGGLS
jgi:molybdopterin-containing oxidoreductase family iron-sulfur binding subunit